MVAPMVATPKNPLLHSVTLETAAVHVAATVTPLQVDSDIALPEASAVAVIILLEANAGEIPERVHVPDETVVDAMDIPFL